MATLEIKNGDIRQIGFSLLTQWEGIRPLIALKGKDLYHLIALKKNIEQRFQAVNETFMAIGQRYGGEIDERGNMKIPDENIEIVNKELTAVANETESIEYTPIHIGDGDNIPTEILEILFDFIEVE